MERYVELGLTRYRQSCIAVRGDEFALIRLSAEADDTDEGAPVDEFLMLAGLDGEGRIARQVCFDTGDLDAAMNQLAELGGSVHSPENAAIHCYKQFTACMVTGDRIGLAETMADGFVADDRRRVVGAGRGGRDAALAHVGVIADLGVTQSGSTVVATRGNRLALLRARFWGPDARPDAFSVDVLHLVEVSEAPQLTGFVAFDVDDLDAAIAELDTRYSAGEAARFAHAWSAIADAYAAFNRREIAPTSEGWVSIDHRRGAGFAPGDMVAYLSAAWADSPDTRIHVDAVHRLTDTGAVVTHAARGCRTTASRRSGGMSTF